MEVLPHTKIFIKECNDLSQPGVLIKEGQIAVRLFSLVTGVVCLAYTFIELHDSFVVGLPFVVTETPTGASARSMSEVSIIRIYKHTISVSALPPPKHLLCYLLVTQNILDRLAGYFSEDRVVQVKSLIEALKENLGGEAKVITVSKESPEKEQKKIDIEEAQNMLDTLVIHNEYPDDDQLPGRKKRYKH